MRAPRSRCRRRWRRRSARPALHRSRCHSRAGNCGCGRRPHRRQPCRRKPLSVFTSVSSSATMAGCCASNQACRSPCSLFLEVIPLPEPVGTVLLKTPKAGTSRPRSGSFRQNARRLHGSSSFRQHALDARSVEGADRRVAAPQRARRGKRRFGFIATSPCSHLFGCCFATKKKSTDRSGDSGDPASISGQALEACRKIFENPGNSAGLGGAFFRRRRFWPTAGQWRWRCASRPGIRCQ